MYAVEHTNAVEDVRRAAQGRSTPKRRARRVPDNWVPCWKELRMLDEYSGPAANPEVERAYACGF